MAEHTEDPQREAFTGAGVREQRLETYLMGDAVVYEPEDPHAPPIGTPEAWNADRWDAGHDGPKSIGEAQRALAERISDPAAPDTIEVAGAYSRAECAE
jgi:hypothetical protein